MHTVTESMHNPVGHLTADHPGVVKIGRAGWFAKGLVYVIAGYLAVSIAAKASGWADSSSTTGDQEASPIGAVKTVAGSGAGTLLLWLLAIGMLLYAAWRVVSALLPGGKDAEAMGHRIGYIASAVMYTTFAISAISLARHSPENPDGNKKVTDISATIMKNGFGRVLIGLAGVIVIAVGLYRVSKGVRMDVEDELDMSGISPARVKWTERIGAIGEVGRGIGFSLVGFFLLRSAMTYDVNEATGLDGALRRAAVHSGGVILVLVVGIGFVAYGIFCLMTFTHRRLEAP
jgi:Domain of Unknown Function (DUF1206)